MVFAPRSLVDYALRHGTGGLFVVLTVILWITRNIHWHGIGAKT